jgi:hypothetical protein
VSVGRVGLIGACTGLWVGLRGPSSGGTRVVKTSRPLIVISLQVGDTLQDIKVRQACHEAEEVLVDRPGRNSERGSRSDMLYAAHLKEARSRMKSGDGVTAHSANMSWEGACHLMLATCETLMAAMSTYSIAQQEALKRAFRAYTPQKDNDPTREALMQTEALSAFGETIEGALRAQESGRIAEPAPPPHPMRGTPLPEVLHSGVLARKNAFGSLFKAKNQAGVAPEQDRPRDFDLSRDVARCDIFLSHSWGVPSELEPITHCPFCCRNVPTHSIGP